MIARLLLIVFYFGFPALAHSFAVIPVREDRDGAGPSHIFHLKDNDVAIVDPLDAKVLVFEVCQASSCGGAGQVGPKHSARFPAGVRPGRLIRRAADVVLVTEDGRAELVVPRDVNNWPSQFEIRKYQAGEGPPKPPAAKRNTSDRITILPHDNWPALQIRTIGPNYLASVRELDSDSAGNRYVLWKELSFNEAPDLNDRTIKVGVHVGRFHRTTGELLGFATVPRDRMTRIGFDYVAIMPSGSVVILADLMGAGFQLGECAVVKPSEITRKAFASKKAVTKWATAPSSCFVKTIETPAVETIGPPDEDVSVSSDGAVQLPAVEADIRLRFRKTMDAFRDASWTPEDVNLRNPCDVPEWAGNCPRPSRFVRPAQFVRKPYISPQRGVAYDWGSADSVEVFAHKLAKGFVAGNIGGTFWANESHRTTTGVDCSGLVSSVWQLSDHVGTERLATVSHPRRQVADMRVGDIFLLEKHHVVLYREQVSTDGASLALRITEASSRCGSVCDSLYEVDFFNGFKLRSRLKQNQ